MYDELYLEEIILQGAVSQKDQYKYSENHLGCPAFLRNGMYIHSISLNM